MGDTEIKTTIFFIFAIGAGLGFYVSRLFFGA